MEEIKNGNRCQGTTDTRILKDYHVIAGKSGLHKEIQGTTLLEAPDALRWAKGKELVLSSGYVLAQEPDCSKKHLSQEACREPLP